jgi:hypothetical protein
MIQGILAATVSATPAPAPVQPAPSAERIGAFEDAMSRHGAEPAAAGEPAPADAYARQGLGLEGAPPATGGDMILDGIQRLRGVFDVREAQIGNLMKGSLTDANALMAMQLEVTKFSLLVDVSSKLTGKATQTFDTLMKGS